MSKPEFPDLIITGESVPHKIVAAQTQHYQGPKDKPEFPDLIVNGETVPHKIVAAETQHYQGPKDKPEIVWRQAANAVAVRTLLLQTATAKGIDVTPADVGAGRIESDEQALVRVLLETELKIDPVSHDAVRTEWERDPSRFRAPPLWEVSHILVICDPRDEERTSAALARASTLAKQAIANPQGFAQLAGQSSDCDSKANGGVLGQLGPGDTVPEFEAVLRTLSEGDITTEPVLTRHGWHIIRMDALAPGAPLPYEAVRPKILEAMEKAAWARAAQTFINELVASANISGADFNRSEADEVETN